MSWSLDIFYFFVPIFLVWMKWIGLTLDWDCELVKLFLSKENVKNCWRGHDSSKNFRFWKFVGLFREIKLISSNDLNVFLFSSAFIVVRKVVAWKLSYETAAAGVACCAFSRALITLLIRIECWVSVLTDDASSSNLNLFGDGSEGFSLLLFEDGEDIGGAWIGGITNWGTGFRLKCWKEFH